MNSGKHTCFPYLVRKIIERFHHFLYKVWLARQSKLFFLTCLFSSMKNKENYFCSSLSLHSLAEYLLWRQGTGHHATLLQKTKVLS